MDLIPLRGPRVDEDFLKHLFEPFARAKPGTIETGYGLAIARRAIQVHQGSIHARNRSDGGLCVDILLPVPATVIDDRCNSLRLTLSFSIASILC
jgi:signal transduction histidine kinase